LDLFEGDDDDEGRGHAGGPSSASHRAEAKVTNVNVDGSAGRKQALDKLVADLGFDDDGGAEGTNGAAGAGKYAAQAKDDDGDDDDLFALMDLAGCK
jgi:hypothetical protein